MWGLNFLFETNLILVSSFLTFIIKSFNRNLKEIVLFLSLFWCLGIIISLHIQIVYTNVLAHVSLQSMHFPQ